MVLEQIAIITNPKKKKPKDGRMNKAGFLPTAKQRKASMQNLKKARAALEKKRKRYIKKGRAKTAMKGVKYKTHAQIKTPITQNDTFKALLHTAKGRLLASPQSKGRETQLLFLSSKPQKKALAEARKKFPKLKIKEIKKVNRLHSAYFTSDLQKTNAKKLLEQIDGKAYLMRFETKRPKTEPTGLSTKVHEAKSFKSTAAAEKWFKDALPDFRRQAKGKVYKELRKAGKDWILTWTYWTKKPKRYKGVKTMATQKQRAAARRNIKKALAARWGKRRSPTKKSKKKKYTVRHVVKKNPKTKATRVNVCTPNPDGLPFAQLAISILGAAGVTAGLKILQEKVPQIPKAVVTSGPAVLGLGIAFLIMKGNPVFAGMLAAAGISASAAEGAKILVEKIFPAALPAPAQPEAPAVSGLGQTQELTEQDIEKIALAGGMGAIMVDQLRGQGMGALMVDQLRGQGMGAIMVDQLRGQGMGQVVQIDPYALSQIDPFTLNALAQINPYTLNQLTVDTVT